EVEEVFSSPTFADYEVILEANYGSGSYSTNPNQPRFSIPYRLFSSLADELGVKVGSMAIRNFMKIPGGTESLRHADVVGSSLHHLILKGGKLIGFKFRPWQAVGLAKNMGNIARFAGPVVGIIVVLFEIVDQVQQTKKEKELCEMQNKIDCEFAAMADEVERQMHEQRQGFEDSVFDYLELKVKSSRDQYIEDMNKKQDQQNSQIQQIKSIQRRLDQLIDVLRKYMSR
ncbi:MAG TPA: LeoA/HP0731 family dynamin-like GTPase, partial [Candidatus Obscuribacterales bacterium]